MTMDTGRSPDGSGHSALQPEPVSRLGHSASVPNAVGSTVWIAQPFGWRSQDVIPFTVERTTKTGQISLVSQSNPDYKIRVNARGRIVGDDRLNRRRIVTAEEASDIRRTNRLHKLAYAIAKAAEALEKAARAEDDEEIAAAFARIASAIEARRAETHSGSVEDESAVAKPAAQGASA